MAKAEWGAKRTCQACGARFYDMQKDPIVCPKCGAEFDPVALFRPRRRGGAAAAVPEPVKAAPLPEEPVVADAAEEEGLEPVEGEAEEEEVIEDASELGEDEDDVSEVIENVDENEER